MKKLIFYSCLLLISISASAQVPGYVPTNGLEGFWPFNGNANDVSGNNNNGFVSNAVLTADKSGIANSAYNFNGTNARIVTTNAPTLTGNYSISAWFNTQSLASWGTIVDCRPNAASGIGIEHNSNLSFTTSTGSSYNNTMSNFSIQTNTWLHVVVVYNGTHKLIYINGVLDKTQLYSNLILSTTQPFIFGDRGIMPSGPGNYFNGTLDDIGIWNRALTQQEITSLYTQNYVAQIPSYVPTNGLVGYWPFNGNANDESGNGNNGVVNGATLAIDRLGVANKSYYFDGNDKISLGRLSSLDTLNANKNISYSIWIKAEQNQSSFAKMPLITKRQAPWQSAGSTQSYFTLHGGGQDFYSRNNKYISYGFVDAHMYTTGINNGLDGGITSDNNWHHIAATKNGFKYKIYYDGQLVDSIFDQSTLYSIDTMIVGFQGMWGFNSEKWYKGFIDDIGIWNRALTQTEINALYNQAPNPVLPSNIPTAGLVAFYPFNGNANDASGNAYNLTQVGTNVITKNDRFNNLNSSYYFGGTNPENKFNFPTSFYPAYNSLNSGSISFWMNIDSIADHSHYFGFDNTFFVKQKNGQNSESYIGLSNGKIRFHMTGALPASNMQVDVKQLVTKKWYNLTVSWTPSNLYIYIDGLLSSSFSGNFGLSNTPSPDFISIGGFYGTGGTGCYSSIDDFGIWNRALTQSEITALYNSPTAAVSDSLWVINKQTDTLAFPSQVKLSLKSNNITSKNISAYDIKLNYDASKLKFDSVTKTNTASANGSVIVNSATTGQVIIGWASSSSISSATLPLLNCFFTPIDSGKTTISISNAIFNTDTVKNRYSKSVINKFNFGDVDMNKIIQSYDASVVLKYSIGIDPLPTLDPLPWEPWRIKVASVDSAVSVDANDASLILKYSVGLITKFPKRGMASAPGYVTVNLENNEIVVRSFEDMGGLNITFLDHLSDLGAPTYVHNTNALAAFNKQANIYKIGVAFSEAPINGTIILRIPYTGLGNQTLNMELVENTAARNYQLNVVTGINDIKNSNIKIYPTPTNNIINIEGLNKNENNTIQIFDVQGKLVITKTITEKGTIDLSELNKGVYVIKIGDVAQRIVKM